MSPEQFIALVVAITPLVAAIGAVYIQLKSLTRRVDGRLTELLELIRTSSHAEGVKDQQAITGGEASEMLSGHRPLDRT